MARPLSQVETDVGNYLAHSRAAFDRAGFADPREPRQAWVLKFFSPRFLANFQKIQQLAISTTAGFTWGDGVYVVPLRDHYSTMMYGRVGVMGRLIVRNLTIWDASQPRGVELYQEWISFQPFLYRLLTTTIHADRANRLLRNLFKQRFSIDLVFFRPDQFSRAYVTPTRDRWFVVSDWPARGRTATGQPPVFSSRILDCKWVAIVGEEFRETDGKLHFEDLIGPHLHGPGPVLARLRPSIAADLTNAWLSNQPILLDP